MVGYIQLNMTRGEITPLLHTRADLDHYRAGVARMFNWVPIRFGGCTRMPGTVYYGATKYPDRPSRFVTFDYRRDQTYAIEAGHEYFRFWNFVGQVVHETSPGPPPVYAPYEVATPYDEADLPFLQFRQIGDVIYLACEGYAPRKLTRVSETNWSLSLHTTIDGPYMTINTEATTLTPSGTSGTVTITASSDVGINDGYGFLLSDVGRHIRLLGSDGNWRWFEIITIVDSVTVTATLRGPSNLPDTTGTASWRLGAWTEYNGYPAAVGVFEDRLGFGGTLTEPLSVWYSVSGAYDRFSVSNPLVDDDAISLRMTGGKMNAVQWLSDGRDILVGTEGSLRAIGRNNNTGAFSPSNVRQRTETAVPAAFVPPLLIENMTLATDIYRTRLYEVGYEETVEGYLARELSALNEHLVGMCVRDWAYQSSPHKIIWAVTDVGHVLACVYDRDQQVFGVSEIRLGPDAYVEAVSVLPGVDRDGDQVWFTVARDLPDPNNPGSFIETRSIEMLSSFWRPYYSAQGFPIYAHCAGTYIGTETNALAGLDHLEGVTVGIWADGVDAGDAVVTNGEISWDEELSAELVVFGIRDISYLQTLRLAVPTEDSGGSLGVNVIVSHMILDIMDAQGLEVGTLSALDTLRTEAEIDEDPYEPAVLRAGAYTVNTDDSWENNGVLVVRSTSMHPATIRGITAKAEVED